MRNAIALVLIARNEERCIARCLARRARMSTMIVLDTGSTDATREIAALRRRVLSATWPDDFSAARNLRASHTAPWRLVLDADEWIAAGAEFLMPSVRAPRPASSACCAWTAWSTTSAGAPSTRRAGSCAVAGRRAL